MKLATLNDGSRDGQLAVVARDLKTAHIADGIAPTLQAALDDWAFIAPQLVDLYAQLNAGRARRPFDFDPAACMAPLPRAHQWAVGSAYAGQDDGSPAMQQRPGDDFLGPMDDIVLAHEEWGIDAEAGIAAVTGEVKSGATADEAHAQIRLLMLANSIALRKLAGPASAPATGFSPVALTPDELGDNWRGGAIHLPLRAAWNARPVSDPHAGATPIFNLPQLIAHLCLTRKARAGSIVGAGLCSFAEPALTGFLRFGDTVRIEMLDEKGRSLFGAIEQKLVRLGR